jgi:23S rRNA-/tRNA-specific pseudouridylate synthase
LKKTFVEKEKREKRKEKKVRGILFDRNLTQRRRGAEDAEGKEAVTFIRPIAAEGNYSLVMAEIATGRTHQIRAQAAAHGYPLLGDLKYGGSGKGGFFLHAWKIEFLEYAIEAPLPENFKDKLNMLKLSF